MATAMAIDSPPHHPVDSPLAHLYYPTTTVTPPRHHHFHHATTTPITTTTITTTIPTIPTIPICNRCIEKHRGVVLKWYTIILDPNVGQDVVYFPDHSEGKAARSVVLENLSNLITEPGFNMADLGTDGTDCLLQLFMWVNKDTGAFRDDPSANVMSEDQDIEVVADDLIAFDTLAVAALDSPPELSKSSEATLLTVSEAIYRARLMGMKRDTWNNEQPGPPR